MGGRGGGEGGGFIRRWRIEEGPAFAAAGWEDGVVFVAALAAVGCPRRCVEPGVVSVVVGTGKDGGTCCEGCGWGWEAVTGTAAGEFLAHRGEEVGV